MPFIDLVLLPGLEGPKANPRRRWLMETVKVENWVIELRAKVEVAMRT